jgi:hypothetical protein
LDEGEWSSKSKVYNRSASMTVFVLLEFLC